MLLAERLRSYAARPVGWAVVPTDLLAEAAARVRPVYTTLADVVIPTRSNWSGVRTLLPALLADPAVGRVRVVVDGDGAVPEDLLRTPTVSWFRVPDRVGIHVMWNVAMRQSVDAHVLFLNDDVVVNTDTVGGMVRTLEADDRLGLVCPNYAGESIHGLYRPVFDTCRGRYDGSGGMAGFAMMLRSTLVPQWTFDERMAWWYGDDDLLAWVTRTMGMRAGICAESRCAGNSSHTISTDPPPGFAELVENDRRVFAEKWGA